MKRTSRGWFLLVVFALYMSVTSIGQVWAQDRGEPIVGADIGQKIEEQPAEEEGSSIWGWIIGAGAVIAAGVAGYLIADKDSDDAEDAADAAAASAAAAEAAAAAPPAAAEEAKFKYKVHITGTFVAPNGDYTQWGAGVANMTPSISFRTPYEDYTGGIWQYTRSDNGAASVIGGDYEQVSDKSILIRVDDILYLGKATSISEDKIRLSNGIVMTATAGSGVYLYPIPE